MKFDVKNKGKDIPYIEFTKFVVEASLAVMSMDEKKLEKDYDITKLDKEFVSVRNKSDVIKALFILSNDRIKEKIGEDEVEKIKMSIREVVLEKVYPLQLDALIILSEHYKHMSDTVEEDGGRIYDNDFAMSTAHLVYIGGCSSGQEHETMMFTAISIFCTSFILARAVELGVVTEDELDFSYEAVMEHNDKTLENILGTETDSKTKKDDVTQKELKPVAKKLEVVKDKDGNIKTPYKACPDDYQGGDK